MTKLLSSWDRIRIIPQLTEVESRKQCNTVQKIFYWDVDIPLIPASMHSIVSQDLLNRVELSGSFVPQPRDVFLYTTKPCYSVSLDKALEVADRLSNNGVLFIEIANGYQWRRLEKVRSDLYNKYSNLPVVGGTVAEYEGAKFFQDIGYNGVLVGIGVGTVCDTTTNTGVGLPAVASLIDLKDKDINIPIILSGGVRTYGDFCKAIALGADLVMSGSLFSRCADNKTYGTLYWGEASKTQKENEEYIEGKTIELTPDKITLDVMKEAKQALQSAMSYSNSFNLREFRSKVIIKELI